MGTPYTVKQGDCLASIAKSFGFSDWRKIYDDPANAEFKKKRPNPNLIFAGDRLTIPDKNPKEVSRDASAQHVFKVKTKKTKVRLKLKNQDDQCFDGKKYKLEVGGRTFQGTTGGDGLVEHEIPADAVDGKLTLWLDADTSKPGLLWALKLGHLDPVDEATGAQARLKNLGFDPGKIDGIVGPKTKAAIGAFQLLHGLQVSSTLDAATRSRLQQLHDEA
jgi:putative peptidoglycan binding protein/LysM domain-containing protein